MVSLKNYLRRITRGVIPYCYCRILRPDSQSLPYYRYISSNGYSRHLYVFRKEYDDLDIDVYQDERNGLRYVLTPKGRRLYFRRDMEPSRIDRMYRSLLMEQDVRSPHCYIENHDEIRGRVLADVGCAEGIFSLDVIDCVRHVYLFECDPGWYEALQATFAPWAEKVTFVRKFVGCMDSESTVRLDTIFGQEDPAGMFIKMDIEGAECMALAGAERLFSCRGLEFAVCAYHNNDTVAVPARLDELGCEYFCRKGFFRGRLRNVVARGCSAGR